MFIGLAGVVSIIPPFTEVAVTIFGLSMIVWFASAGTVLLRSQALSNLVKKAGHGVGMNSINKTARIAEVLYLLLLHSVSSV
jgi:hypothetical protein